MFLKKLRPQNNSRFLIACRRKRAVAGAGKTTTAVLLTRRLLQAEPDTHILYLVFNKKAREEALNRFPKEVAVFTSHALAKKHCWPGAAGDFPRPDTLVQQFNLFEVAEQRFGSMSQLAAFGQKILNEMHLLLFHCPLRKVTVQFDEIVTRPGRSVACSP